MCLGFTLKLVSSYYLEMLFVYNRSLLENYSLDIREGVLGPVLKGYRKLWDILMDKGTYDPVCLLDIEPEDKVERFRWIQHISLPVLTVQVLLW